MSSTLQHKAYATYLSLTGSQLADGSWYVKSRALPIQPFFESGFPYGRDQFVSAAATNWPRRPWRSHRNRDAGARDEHS